MTYDAYETSIEDGRPTVLYRFTLGPTVWRYACADEDLTIAGFVWKAMPLSDDGVKQTGESASDTLNIEGSNRIGPAQIFRVSPPAQAIRAEKLYIHEGMTTPVVGYVGEVVSCDEPVPGSCRLACQSLAFTMRRQGVRLGWQKTCPYALYDPLTCKVNKADFDQAITIESVSGFDVSSSGFAAFADGYFAGGFIAWSDPVRGIQFVTIESHAGADVSMLSNGNMLYPGLVVTAYPGCARTPTACKSFGNYLNYGGFEYLPGKSPFDGDPVF